MGITLVALQFALIILLAWLASPAVVSGEAPTAAWVCAVLGLLLGMWAVSVNGLGNFNIRPAPRAGGTLIEQRSYRWNRHPMCTAVIASALNYSSSQ